MDAAMDFLPINNIKQEKETEAPTSACGDGSASNSNNLTTADQPDSVENKVSYNLKPHIDFLPV